MSHIVDPERAEDEAVSRNDRDGQIVAWCMSRVEEARIARDQKYLQRWQEYYRLWRGIWAQEDKERQSERSKLISPALQSAVESTTAEIEEAIFGRKQWFDTVDDYKDRLEGRDQDLQKLRDWMLEQFDRADVPSACAKVFLSGALYGTGIGKIVTEERIEKVVKPSIPWEQQAAILQQMVQQGVPPDQAHKMLDSKIQWNVEDERRFLVKLDPIDPFDFVIDVPARSIDEAEFCAHETFKSEHAVIARQREGIYRNIPIGTVKIDRKSADFMDDREADAVKITEYYGLVPESLLDLELEEDEELVELPVTQDDQELESIDLESESLVEAIVTIANDAYVLRAIRNPFWGEDRPIIAYQHDTVPNSFWGRGICEKGYNSQKALDAELRARMDGLALSVHPMMAFDVTRMPRGSNFTVHPGKSVPVNGNPREVLNPFNFGQIDPLIFQSAGDLERMVQVATGTTDPSTPLNISRTNSTASGMSMALSSAIKRSKRTLANIERNFIKPFLKKAAWRFMQFDPENFPVKDINFITHSTLGITARELEQQQLISLLQTVPPESPAFMVMLKAIYDNSSLTNKEELVTVISQMMQPNPEQEQIQKLQMQLQIAKLQAEVEERKSRTASNYADIQKTMADIGLDQDKLDMALQKEILDLLAARASSKQNEAKPTFNGQQN